MDIWTDRQKLPAVFYGTFSTIRSAVLPTFCPLHYILWQGDGTADFVMSLGDLLHLLFGDFIMFSCDFCHDMRISVSGVAGIAGSNCTRKKNRKKKMGSRSFLSMNWYIFLSLKEESLSFSKTERG